MSSGAERQRRYRAHQRGDHRLCLHGTPDQPEQPAATPIVTPVTASPVPSPDLTEDDRWNPPAPISAAVDAALAAAAGPDTDAGAVALVRRYAELIDAAAADARYYVPMRTVAAAVALSADPKADEHWHKIETALAAHTVASDLGPKLLAALTALGMTAAGRGVKGVPASAQPVVSELDKLRAKRAARGAR